MNITPKLHNLDKAMVRVRQANPPYQSRFIPRKKLHHVLPKQVKKRFRPKVCCLIFANSFRGTY